MTGGIAISVREGTGVGVLRIDNPDTRNALSQGLLSALATGLERLDADPEVRVIALTGTDDEFATGADHATLTSADAAIPLHEEFWQRFSAIERPIVAGVAGFALGTGFELALACDVLVASRQAKLGAPEVTLGLVPGGLVIERLTRTLGAQRAMELLLVGEPWEAEELHRHGLVNVVSDRKHWFQNTLGVAGKIARAAPISVRLTKRAILAAERQSYPEGLEAARAALATAITTEDRVEGVSAYLEQRPPRFEGR